MNRKVLATVSVIFLILTITTVSLVQCVEAAPTFQEITGKLGGADYLIRIPLLNWNGRLVVFCHGYSHLEPDLAYLETQAASWNSLVTGGFALAMSTYGAGGYCIKEGVIRTHQLTEYTVENYGVTGAIYLIGGSMGGNIALQLGAKYPDLYSGVLDLYGSKNLISQYHDKMYYASIQNDADLGAVVVANGGVNPPYPYATIAAFRDFSLASGTDIALACGGTPEEKPMAYERISPTFSAVDITIPTITLHGTKDALVPYASALEFMSAVAEAGHSDMYRLYKVVDGQHGGSLVLSKLTSSFTKLLLWAEYGIIPVPSDP